MVCIFTWTAWIHRKAAKLEYFQKFSGACKEKRNAQFCFSGRSGGRVVKSQPKGPLPIP